MRHLDTELLFGVKNWDALLVCFSEPMLSGVMRQIACLDYGCGSLVR
jgi:hypothetical protein